ncbi:DUF58 domain-containing protein [Knoellia aerolata]|uniref:ATPase n=1 Tax=Knoellia aerolata DSM 18566 TaxID=1385519 RepID=A0A0A0JTW2_9MICO|nr:DUF58 domain-containing protein [Knoellia aerolata]KGN40573.1 ATPase [Knoellia aerolata DSM 18566]
MVTAPERLLLRLEWQVLRRLDGRLNGAYRTHHRGGGVDLAGLREYVDTDDARRIDWSATARVGETLVREYNEDRDLTVWLVLDRSGSMGVGAEGRTKRDVLTELALLLARLFARPGNRVGAVLYDGAAARVVTTGTGRAQALRIGRELLRETRVVTTTTDLAGMLESVAVPARRRALVVVISDFIGSGPWTRPLAMLAYRHDVVALRIVDAADGAIPDVGLLVVEDAETGEQVLVDASDPVFRAGMSSAVAARDAEVSGVLRHVAVPLHQIRTDQDLVDALVRLVAATRWRR